MAKRYFVGVESKNDKGVMMCGCSFNGKDYVVTSNSLHADQIPEECADAQTFSELAAGLLNAFYNGVDVSNMEAADVMRMGKKEVDADIPSPQNTEIPF